MVHFQQRPRLLLALAGLLGSGHVFATPPVLLDDRLELSLFAEHPRIVTPIGLAIDDRDRIYVLESHTHTPSPDYAGPKGDIVKVFVDADGDGKSDGEPSHFAEGITAGMNLGFSREGILHVCTAWALIALPDKDGDGRADEQKTLLRLETENTYPHSAQMGIAFSHDDWIYISRGNNGGYAWTVHGTDGSKTGGYGDGGSVYRCRLDGSRVEAVATGFWNPMNLKFDARGRLLLVDNDPDARGPNRLVQVVAQGDYGHKSIFGGGGNHPFQGWDGTLPGTLGYVDGIGEAPCDLIDTSRTSFPVNYREQLLVTVWNENHVACYVTRTNGVSLTATHSIWLQGDQDFRPVALEANRQGDLFITDWVKVDYPNHGHGRIWRISAKGDNRLTPRRYFDPPLEDPGMADFKSLIEADNPADFRRLERALISDDPFVRHAAVVALSQPRFLPNLVKTMYRSEPRARLGALLAMRRGNIRGPELYLKRFLSDRDEDVRRAALMWVGEAGLTNLQSELNRTLAFDDLSATLFATYLAAYETLGKEFIERRERKQGRAPMIRRTVDLSLIERIVRDREKPDRVRALALTHLKNAPAPELEELLRELARGSTPRLQREAIRSLSETGAGTAGLFLDLAEDSSQPEDVRAEAVFALSQSLVDDPRTLLPLLKDKNDAVRTETLRALWPHREDEVVRASLLDLHESLKPNDANAAELAEIETALATAGEPRGPRRPDTVEGWLETLKTGGNPSAGERVFFSAKTQCATCHQINNRGRRIGPELSNLGQSVSRGQIIRSILRPGEQFAPQYQAWFVELKNGDLFQGLQLDHQASRGIELFTTEGITRSFKGTEIERYGLLPNSLMPEGLEQTMNLNEFRDLVAFLESQK